MTRVVLVGAGGHAQVVADILLQQKKQGQTVEVIGFVDDNPQLAGQKLLDLPVLGQLTFLHEQKNKFDQLIVAIGHNQTRKKLATHLQEQGFLFSRAVHPSAVIAHNVSIQPGAMICAQAVLNPGAQIGAHVIINTAATVDHHTVVGPFAHLAPGTHTGGEVKIEEGAFLGVGALVLPRVKIGSWSVVGGGALVNKDVAEGETVVGVPARPLLR